MRITFVGHAGLFIEAAGASILCDPWFSPAFFDAWFPFPRNDGLRDDEAILSPDFLYVSHSHRDHFDASFLARVSKRATVLLPDFALRDHELALSALGFDRTVRLRSGRAVVLGDLRVAIDADTDEATGDSALMIDDGETRILNQNDARPLSLGAIASFGPYDAHFVQFSGAMWYPAVYCWPADVKARLVANTREAQARRALTYIRDIGATHIFPCAGPACFLDDELFALNDIPGKNETIFPDQTIFLDRLRRDGLRNGHLVVPGTVINLKGRSCTVDHLKPEATIRTEVFVDKETYLHNYAADVLTSHGRGEGLSSGHGSVDLVAALEKWVVPIMAAAPTTCAGIGSAVLLDCGDQAVQLDFVRRTVSPYDGNSNCRYRFFVRRGIIESLIRSREVDWVNALFLSCRFAAEREGGYNEWVYTFFKGMSVSRARHLELVYSTPPPDSEPDFEVAGYLVQRRCPHFKADLKRFGRVDDGILTCAMHGWQFELESGRCLTAEGRTLRSTRLEPGSGTRAPTSGGINPDDSFTQ